MDSLRPLHRGGLHPPLHARWGSHSTASLRTPCTSTAHVPGTVDDHLNHEGNLDLQGMPTPSTSIHCSTLQHTATHRTPSLRTRLAVGVTLQHTATRCNAPQRTVTRRNTLYHTAAHCACMFIRMYVCVDYSCAHTCLMQLSLYVCVCVFVYWYARTSDEAVCVYCGCCVCVCVVCVCVCVHVCVCVCMCVYV